MALLAIMLTHGCKNEAQSNLEKVAKVEEIKAPAWIAGPAGKIFVDRGGAASKALASALPVVIVHSLAGNVTQWQAQLQHLRKTRFAAAFDMRGHGQSGPAPNHDYSLTAMAEDLAIVVDSLDLHRFILIGHSYGGGVIAAYAGMHPERVAGLLFVDPIGDARKAPKDEIDKWLSVLRTEAYAEAIEAHWRSILMNADSSVTQAVIASLHHTPKEAVLGALDNVFLFDPAAALQAYGGPMETIVSGLPDDPSALHHAIPNLPRVVMPGTSHWLQMDRPEEFNRLMDEFLNKIYE
ncbi:MAG: alpha/beta fold hydrolase [bacterium]